MAARNGPAWYWLFAVVVLLFASGCATSTRVYVKSTDQTNDGNTLYMMVRATDGRGVATESYQDAAVKLFSDPPDTSVITNQPIFPGNTTTVTIPETDKDVAVYFFFTNPTGTWRVPLRQPLPAEVYVELGQHQIERIQIRKR